MTEIHRWVELAGYIESLRAADPESGSDLIKALQSGVYQLPTADEIREIANQESKLVAYCEEAGIKHLKRGRNLVVTPESTISPKRKHREVKLYRDCPPQPCVAGLLDELPLGSWPINVLPEKRESKNISRDNMWNIGHVDGWNACIDSILFKLHGDNDER